MSLFYSAFGLSLGTDHPIPGLVPQPAGRPADARIWLDPASLPAEVRDLPRELWYATPRITEEHPPALRAWRLDDGAYFRLVYSDGTEFLVDGAGTGVWARWIDPLTIEDTATYLLGPVLGFVLRLRGVTCLHGSAVALGDRAVALVGPASAGKSTTAAFFARMGLRVMADDIVALVERDGEPWVQPAYPQLRLWPESVTLLYGSADALPRLTPNWDKRALDLAGGHGRFQRRALPLAAIYLLGGRSQRAGGVVVEDIAPAEALLTLVANSYVGYLLDAPMRAREFTTLARVVTAVRMRRVTVPNDPARVPDLCRAIVADLEKGR